MMPPDDGPNPSLARLALIAGCVGAIAGVVLAMVVGLSSCTPEHRAAAMEHSTTAAKFGACAMNVLAEEEAARLRAVREQERIAEEEATNIADAAREHSPDTKSELDKYMRVRDGGVQ
jgi:hypothetical protein